MILLVGASRIVSRGSSGGDGDDGEEEEEDPCHHQERNQPKKQRWPLPWVKQRRIRQSPTRRPRDGGSRRHDGCGSFPPPKRRLRKKGGWRSGGVYWNRIHLKFEFQWILLIFFHRRSKRISGCLGARFPSPCAVASIQPMHHKRRMHACR